MLSEDKVQIHANVPEQIKERLKALSAIDKVLFSESRVIWQCCEMALPKIEEHATSPFNVPTHDAPGKRRRLRKV